MADCFRLPALLGTEGFRDGADDEGLTDGGGCEVAEVKDDGVRGIDEDVGETIDDN